MHIEQIYENDLSHSSYIVTAKKHSIVIDPKRDIGIYIEKAKSMETRITHILETHLHADFVSGHIELAMQTGARICGPKKARFAFEHIGLEEKDTLEVENLVFSVLETPGHTPEIICYLLYDKETSKVVPICVFSGDTLFVGDVGRPDLFPDRKDELTKKLYESLDQKIKRLPDHCEVYPAHGPGSLCGKAIGNRRTTTIGYEKKTNRFLKIEDFEKFKKALLDDMPQAPAYYGRSTEINRQGPKPLQHLERLMALTEEDAASLLSKTVGKIEVIDCREFPDFSAAHIKDSLNIDISGSFAAFSGWFADKDRDILLVSSSMGDTEAAYMSLRRVGLDKRIYYLLGGMEDWLTNGKPYSSIALISAHRLHERLNAGKGKLGIIDVRNPYEYRNGHFDVAVNIPFYDIAQSPIMLEKDKEYVVHCTTGIRSSIACSFLKRKGFKDISNLSGGINGYINAGYRI